MKHYTNTHNRPITPPLELSPCVLESSLAGFLADLPVSMVMHLAHFPHTFSHPLPTITLGLACLINAKQTLYPSNRCFMTLLYIDHVKIAIFLRAAKYIRVVSTKFLLEAVVCTASQNHAERQHHLVLSCQGSKSRDWTRGKWWDQTQSAPLVKRSEWEPYCWQECQDIAGCGSQMHSHGLLWIAEGLVFSLWPWGLNLALCRPCHLAADKSCTSIRKSEGSKH